MKQALICTLHSEKYLPYYMDGKEPEGLRKQEMFSAETKDELSSPFSFFGVNTNILKKQRIFLVF